jgi:NAD(P)H-flavin reductase
MLAAAPSGSPSADALVAKLNDELRAEVKEVIRHTPNIVEIVVRAPLAARAFEPGQFYRLQNYETRASIVDGTRLAMEGLALTGASVDRERGLLSTIVLEMGGSSDLCAQLQPGEPVILMGPTGTPTEIEAGETVALVGGGLGNAVLFSIGQAFRAKGSRVLYFAGYKKLQDRYKVDEIEKAADAMVAYASGALGEAAVPLADADRIIAIGSDGMMAAVARARHGELKPFIKPTHIGIGSINSPMQCMMKEICAQCLQAHRDPETGEETVVFSCFNQDQHLDRVEFAGLRQRLRQNAVQEKLTAQWIDRCLRHTGQRAAAE